MLRMGRQHVMTGGPDGRQFNFLQSLLQNWREFIHIIVCVVVVVGIEPTVLHEITQIETPFTVQKEFRQDASNGKDIHGRCEWWIVFTEATGRRVPTTRSVKSFRCQVTTLFRLGIVASSGILLLLLLLRKYCGWVVF